MRHHRRNFPCLVVLEETAGIGWKEQEKERDLQGIPYSKPCSPRRIGYDCTHGFGVTNQML
jgi:hypothetical protein